MDARTALALGESAGFLYRRARGGRSGVVLARDTRSSGDLLESALAAGFVSVGVRVHLAGVLPTPATAFLTQALRARLGVVISASHNPYTDNGIKFFSGDGKKLSKMAESRILELVRDLPRRNTALVDGRRLGYVERLRDAPERYIASLRASKTSGVRQLCLRGMRIAVDCAHGAGYQVAPQLFRELGADVVSVAASPNGRNINEKCGSTYPLRLRRAVRATRADFGLALDGDGDRVVLCDEKGNVADGDQILALLATDMQQRCTLRGNKVIGTIFSNASLDVYLSGLSLELERAPVGDRHVSAWMRRLHANLGGEPSGHVVLNAGCGDGLATALACLDVVRRRRQPASQVLHVFAPSPSALRSVFSPRSAELARHPRLRREVRTAKQRLGARGRVVLRPSGTEPALRMMVEGAKEKEVHEILRRLCDVATSLAGEQ